MLCVIMHVCVCMCVCVCVMYNFACSVGTSVRSVKLSRDSVDFEKEKGFVDAIGSETFTVSLRSFRIVRRESCC